RRGLGGEKREREENHVHSSLRSSLPSGAPPQTPPRSRGKGSRFARTPARSVLRSGAPPQTPPRSRGKGSRFARTPARSAPRGLRPLMAPPRAFGITRSPSFLLLRRADVGEAALDQGLHLRVERGVLRGERFLVERGGVGLRVEAACALGGEKREQGALVS